MCLLSPARSYSTVSVMMLGQHPLLYGFPELYLWCADTVGEVLDAAAAMRPDEPARQLPGLRRALSQLHEGAQHEDGLARALEWLRARSEWPSALVYDHLLEAVAPRRGVEKSPLTLPYDGAIERFARDYPAACYIHLVRDPASTLRSVHRHLRLWHERTAGAGPWNDGFDRWAWIWGAMMIFYSHCRILDFCAPLERRRYVRVKGEKLVARSPRALEPLAGLLGLEEAAMASLLARPEESPYAVLGDDDEHLGGLDIKFARSPRLREVPPLDPERYDALNLPEGWQVRLRRLAARLGYR